jgi:hypothetical protein
MKKLLLIFCSLIVFVFGCKKEIFFQRPIVDNVLNGDKTTPENSVQRKVMKSYKIHEDNINGASLKRIHRIQEAVLYFFNENNLLDSLCVLTDTTSNSIVKRTMKLNYSNADSVIKASMYDQSSGYFIVDFHYDTYKNVLRVTNQINGIENGIYYIYSGNLLTNKKYKFGKVAIAGNFVYDNLNNLMQYELHTQIEDAVNIEFQYNNIPLPDQTFDIRFNSKEISFLYEGGVNILSLMGLKDGAGNQYFIQKRTERYLNNGEQRNVYDYDYHFDAQNRLTGREILINDSLLIKYEYQY